MKTITTSDLIKEIEATKTISERQIKLLQRRANAGDKEADFWGDDIQVDEEYSAKLYKTIYNMYKTPTGKVRKNSPIMIEFLEADIIDNYKGERFDFVGLHNNGNRYFDIYIPLYRLYGGEHRMEFYFDGKLNIIG